MKTKCWICDRCSAKKPCILVESSVRIDNSINKSTMITPCWKRAEVEFKEEITNYN